MRDVLKPLCTTEELSSTPEVSVSNEQSNAKARLDSLTPRRREVLDGIVAGHSNKVIAYMLGISPRTVEIHRSYMMRDLGVRSVAEAIRLAVEAGTERPKTAAVGGGFGVRPAMRLDGSPWAQRWRAAGARSGGYRR